MIVAKFGGSSLADASQFQKVKAIVEADPERQIVVCSAAGRRTKTDNKITDLLYLCHAHLQYSVSCEPLFDLIRQRFCEIRDVLGLSLDLEEPLAQLKEKMRQGISQDELVSRGEWLTSKLMAAYLDWPFVDAAEVIRFGYDGKIDHNVTRQLIRAQAQQTPRFVIPGFYGALPNGRIKVMARGGSDITGSLMASALSARLYENWTDVSGILMADPRIIDHPVQIERITYSELRELSYMGANVLHEDAIYPVKDANIPIVIRNTNQPDNPGTQIVDHVDPAQEDRSRFVTGIAGKKDFTVITMYRHNASNEVGLLKRALEVLEKYKISVEHVPSGIDNFSIVVSTAAIADSLYEIAAQLKQVCKCDDIKVVNNLSLIAVVGRNMALQCGISGQLFQTLGAHQINIRMIAQGSDEINIIVGVENEDFSRAIQVLYAAFSPKAGRMQA